MPIAKESSMPSLINNALGHTITPNNKENLQITKNYNSQNSNIQHNNAQQNIPNNEQNKQKNVALKIKIDQRTFSLSLLNFDPPAQEKMLMIFQQKSYSLEELLAMFVAKVRDESLAEQELAKILVMLQSKNS